MLSTETASSLLCRIYHLRYIRDDVIAGINYSPVHIHPRVGNILTTAMTPVIYTISHTPTGTWSIYQQTKTNAKAVYSAVGLYFRYTEHQMGYLVVFSPSAPSLLPSVHGKPFSLPTGWRTIAETPTTLPHWLKLTQTHSVSIASSIRG